MTMHCLIYKSHNLLTLICTSTGPLCLPLSAVEPATITRYTSAGRKIRNWAADMGVPLLQLTVFMLLSFFADLMLAGYSYTTANHVRSYLAMVFHLALCTPITDDPLIRMTLRGYKRATAAWIRRRDPICKHLVARIRHWIATHLFGEFALECLAAIDCLYDGLMRRMEVFSLEARDLSIDPRGIRVFIARSKTDPMGMGAEALVTPGHHLRQLWASRTGKLFLYLNPNLLLSLIKDILPSGNYVLHSFRHGKATDLFRAGWNLWDIATRGRWRTIAALRLYLHRCG